MPPSISGCGGWSLWLLIIAILACLPITQGNHSHDGIRFSHSLYNVSVPENSPGKTFLTQPANEESAGLRLFGIWQQAEVKYKIAAGDKDKFFKAEERTVGDFSFLILRTRTGNTAVLNRERKDRYLLEIHATVILRQNGKSKIVSEADTNVSVTILDTNDLNPLFYPNDQYAVTINEDTPVHSEILRVVAEDADLGINGEIYYSFVEQTDQFAVHPTSGFVTLTRPLSFTEKSLHELQVLATDRGGAKNKGTGHSSKAKVRVKVRQVNLFAPDIYVHPLPDILENSDFLVYAIVRVVDKDSGVHGQVKSLDIVDGDPDGHFRVRRTNTAGEFNIEVHKKLDREATPQGYNLTLRAVDRGTPTRESYKAVPVHLLDANDNAPVFARELYEISVPETSPVNSPVIRLKVTDKDEGKNAQVFLEIVGGNEGNEFWINPNSGMLYTAVLLDAESKAFYTLTVSAIDQGNTGTRKQSSAKVKINVQDANDNDPEFDQTEMTVWADENEPGGTFITKVSAKDRDSGENAYISYSIANIEDVPFEIEHFTGAVRTTRLLDYESMRREYALMIRASDWGLPYRRQTELRLNIKLRDVNDNRPQFERVDCEVRLSRFAAIGTEVITLSAIDLDAGNIIYYRVVSGSEDDCFALDTTSGVLTVDCDLSDVRSEERFVNATATDGKHFSDVVTVHIKLTNSADKSGVSHCRETGVARRLTEALASAERNNLPLPSPEPRHARHRDNLHAPEFIDFPNEIRINESAPLGTILVKLRARDRDVSYNGRVIFGISGGDSDSVFRLDPETGELQVIGFLDREHEYEYYLNVTVYDLGKPQKSQSRIIPVTILDVNDNPPRFEKSFASFRVSENALNGTVIFRPNATDVDFGINAKVRYSLVTDTKDFAVNPDTGYLYVSDSLDREIQELYELRLRATDGGGLYSDALVRVTVDDVNDNPPKFALDTVTVRVREDVPLGSLVAMVDASDPDLGAGGVIKYSLIPDEAEGEPCFRVDKKSGAVRVSKLLDFEERQLHTLTIEARDSGSPALSSRAMLIVEIVDVDENNFAPVFSDFVLSGSVSENLPAGAKVMRAAATDDDPAGPCSRITYTITGGTGLGYFTIDDKDGTIKTTSVLDAETTPFYWLTVCAKDQAVVPKHNCVQVYIEVSNVNDNAPMTESAVYKTSVAENSPAGVTVILLEAVDIDRDDHTRLSFRFSSGNAEGFFAINSSSGLITTTSRRLDREHQAEHILEVVVSDNGVPALSSVTKVIVAILDVNDHSPEFKQRSYTVRIPATAHIDQPLFQVLAVDRDTGDNGRITYSIKSGRGKAKFRIHPETGVVYAQRIFEAKQEFDISIKATDNGLPQRSDTAFYSVRVVEPLDAPLDETQPPPLLVAPPDQTADVTENDEPRFLVALIETAGRDQGTVWYDIIGGDERNEFYIDHEKGNVLLAKKLDREIQQEYNLTIAVTDGISTVHTQLFVSVIDINDNRPIFSEELYSVQVSEGLATGTEVLRLAAVDADGDKLFFTLQGVRSPADTTLFKVDSLTGSVTLAGKLDRETAETHLLTVSVRDHGAPSRRDAARILVTVHDRNDHAPDFGARLLQAACHETAAMGSLVARARAADRDKGDNARVIYSIVSGNVGNAFNIDPVFGDVRVARGLDMNSAAEYMLQLRAQDFGNPPLVTTIPLHVMITMADNAPPRFLDNNPSAEVFENAPAGNYVLHLNARASSSLMYEIREGNENGVFDINPSTGILRTTALPLDYETKQAYNLTVTARSMTGAEARIFVLIHVLDRNDNAPYFELSNYTGFVSESSEAGAQVLTNLTAPLVIKARDLDSGPNALLQYEILEILPRQYFKIDSGTGAIQTTRTLDYETIPKFHFHVKVTDFGKPRLSSESTAEVFINVNDVNDSPPVFPKPHYNVTLLLPTFKNIVLTSVKAFDPDTTESLRYDIIDGDETEAFEINSKTGVIITKRSDNFQNKYNLRVRVSDGSFSSVTRVFVKVKEAQNGGLLFRKSVYEGSIVENSTRIATVCVVDIIGTALNEHVEFKILNPTELFTIGKTSGAIQTTGQRFDRELEDHYELIVEARTSIEEQSTRVTRTLVNVTILDINDNCPMFVNLPYYAVVSIDDQRGRTITQVRAIDLDSNENGEVRYEMKRGPGELFKVCRKTGEVTLKQNLEGHNREYELVIGAYDGGTTPCSTEVSVHVKVIDRSMPVFDRQFYSAVVPEDTELRSPIAVSVRATSPLNRQLIYSIVTGNEKEQFALDFNTAPDSSNGPCVIYVADELDYETTRQYELTLRATDGVSGVWADVVVSVLVSDVNDCPPEFVSDSYNVTVSEADPFGTAVLRVQAKDNDTNVNQEIIYSIRDDHGNASEYFHMEPSEGVVYLKKSLDHEQHSTHHFTVMATDKGTPSLSSTAHVWVTVLDMNDNTPKFEKPSYSCNLSQHASRGQFVTAVKASDPDRIDRDRLRYSIVRGNELQTFGMDSKTGVLRLVNLKRFSDQQSMVLNVSVTDGVHTSFARLKVTILPANLHDPVFPEVQYSVLVKENQLAGRSVTKVKAIDKDFGEYGQIAYSIPSDAMREIFAIDKITGDVVTKIKLDRELKKMYEVVIMATDGGARNGFLTLRVNVGDENDNAPEFLMKEYKANIKSDLQINSTFLKVHALDKDEDLAGQVRYSIYDSTNSGVKELFSVHPTHGSISIIKDAEPFINQMFQFFIRAEDLGSPSLHSDVPVYVYIMAPSDVPPLFEKKEEKFFLSENSPIGTIVTRLKMVTNVTANFYIISGDEGNNQFNIDSTGQLTLAKSLDRESKDTHVIGVLAETDSSPPLSALVEIILKVLDENDHAPVFDSNPYSLVLAENVNEATAIFRVKATDADLGSNGEVRYSFSSDIGDLANVFAVDQYTGVITTLVPLDKEHKSEYRFQVVATDNGNQKLSARTSVLIKLKDYNDSPPVFKSNSYEATVKEDALPGTVVVKLSITDFDTDLNNPVEYYITKGDLLSQFQIRPTGEVYVAKSLDREALDRYDMEVTVTDGKFTDVTYVTVHILDANDNPPYCLRYRYRETVSEGVYTGSFVLAILATDSDEEENSKLRYYLTGAGSDDFVLDKLTGHLKTARSLDRETRSKYQLIAHVQDMDRPSWECSSIVEILISDLNDNHPVFSSAAYSVALPEDAEIGSLVTKIHATDDDVGLNRKIRYSFLDSMNDHFSITPDSGIIILSKPLDREVKALYNLTVQAEDQGSPRLTAVTSLVVNVQDINDNPPEFTSKYYFASVPEINSIGSEVIHVLATSKDTGPNAEIYYSIVGGNEHKKFNITSRTGVIAIADLLDYERTKDYFLTIQAVDGGIPPLSNMATVNISITDSNDNLPIFTQESYSARIREDAQIGDKILQVAANDLDSNENGQISYLIVGGDRGGHFTIEKDTGYITVGADLDRETISNYVLEVQAKDSGIPVLSNQVFVNVIITDANDNPPIFTKSNYSAIVREDMSLGHVLLKFDITDADSHPNTSPYTFDFRSGNEDGVFRLEQDGVLRTAGKFNHALKESYLLHVRVFDNGTPPLYSDTYVKIKVIEESQYPPVIIPLEISINSLNDEYGGGLIGKVHANDQDPYDTLSFALAPNTGMLYDSSVLFTINSTNGELTALPHLDVGEYKVNVTVTDGKFMSSSFIKVSVDLISDEMLNNAASIKFRKISPADFVLSHRKGFVRCIKNAMNTRLKDVIIISVQPVARVRRSSHERALENDLEVLFAVRKLQPSVTAFYTSDAIRRTLSTHMDELEEATKLVVEDIPRSVCSGGMCLNGGSCSERVLLDPNDTETIATDVTSFVCAKHQRDFECSCRQGYFGNRCESILDACAGAPCPGLQICVHDPSNSRGYACRCPRAYEGPGCDAPVGPQYSPIRPVSFSGRSYAQYSVHGSKAMQERLVMSLKLRTVQLTGCLMYAAGKFDYNILEIVNGMLQYRFDLGSGEGLVRVASASLSDGRWHEATLERDGASARLTVDKKHVAHGSSPGSSEILHLQQEDVYLGAEVRQHPSVLGFEQITRGFTGCLDDVRLSGVPVPLLMGGTSSSATSPALLTRFANVEFSCDSAATALTVLGACTSQPCLNGGTCENSEVDSTGYTCRCPARFSGLMCEVDSDPCASSPCLHGGVCSPNLLDNDYICTCPPPLTGKRCQVGRWCHAKACSPIGGAACEEGDTGPLCKCAPGYSGSRCELDVDECAGTGAASTAPGAIPPCLNGAECRNELGGYRCVCAPGTTGQNCGNPLHPTAITSSIYSITWEELIGIIIAISVIILAVIIFILYRKCHYKRSRELTNNIINETAKNHKDITTQNHNHHAEFKRGSKISNLEAIRRNSDNVRPVSYAPGGIIPPPDVQPSYNLILNNLDTLRSYGSAGDDLAGDNNSTVPLDYVRNLNQPQMTAGATANVESLHKPSWTEQMPLQTFSDSKINNDLKRPIISTEMTLKNSGNRNTGILAGRLSQQSRALLNSSEDDTRTQTSYHWDCSDWARRSQNPLPDITEVPGGEMPDSSSFHSNESNESHRHTSIRDQIAGQSQIEHSREILNEEDDDKGEYSEYVCDSECDERSEPQRSLRVYDNDLSIGGGLNSLDSGSDDYAFNPAPSRYLQHPNQYLPTYNNIPSETEGETTSLNSRVPIKGLHHNEHGLGESDDDDDDDKPYGFPAQNHKRRNRRLNGVQNASKGENNSLLYRGASNSDLSNNLCEIDSECEQESHPLKWSKMHQTAV